MMRSAGGRISPCSSCRTRRFIIEHEKKLADLDFAELVADQRFPNSRLVVLVPIVVIDELDRLKDRSSNSHVKWRAGHALGFIYEKLKDADHPAQIQPPEPQEFRGPVVMELILDPPGHVRLPIDDGCGSSGVMQL